MEQAAQSDAAAGKERGPRQVKVGQVVSDKADKTVVVAINKTVMHRLYHRLMTRSLKLMAHDESNECRVGDTVEVVSTRPLSKRKRWKVRQILKRAEGN